MSEHDQSVTLKQPLPKLLLLNRDYCSLCERMQTALQHLLLQGRLHFTVELIDVDADDALEAAWGECVPALFLEDISAASKICHYHLDERALNKRLSLS